MLTCRLNVILAERRMKKGDFARSLGIGLSTFSAWCNDKALPSLETAYKVAEALNLNVMEVWVKSDEPS